MSLMSNLNLSNLFVLTRQLITFNAEKYIQISPQTRRIFSKVQASGKVNDHLVTFDELEKLRREQANRSVLVTQPTVTRQVFDYCQRWGKIKKAISFKRASKPYTLVEYEDLAGVERLIAVSSQFPDQVCLATRFLYFKAKLSRHSRPSPVEHFDFHSLVNNYGTSDLVDADFLRCSSVDAQMALLHEKLSMSDLDIRLRYLMCIELETVVQRVFPSAVVRLFGSSVSGLGRYDCDIDMVLDENSTQEALALPEGAMYFMSKMKTGGDDQFVKQTLNLIGHLLRHLTPQIINVQNILRARVPIVKFTHTSTDFECDLSMHNTSAVDMSRLLYYLCQLDGHVVPLLFTVRHWARSNGLIRTFPGLGISNFMLTMLTVVYLQTKTQPLLPSLIAITDSQGLSRALSPDVSLPLGHFNSPRPTSRNLQSLEELLLEFFEFYSDIDLTRTGLSVINGMTVAKPTDATPLYIENPLQKELNVARNVGEKEVEEFQALCRTARERLLKHLTAGAANEPWGLLTVLKLDTTNVDECVVQSSTDSSCVLVGDVDLPDTATSVEPQSNAALASKLDSVPAVFEVLELARRFDFDVEFAVTSQSGPPHAPHFVMQCTCSGLTMRDCEVQTVVTEGKGSSKRLAKKQASQKMLVELTKRLLEV